LYNTANINPLPQIKYTGGENNMLVSKNDELVVKDIFDKTKEFQKNQLQNGSLALQVSEDQLNFYLDAKKEPNSQEVINSLTINEISQQLEEQPELLDLLSEDILPNNQLDSVNDPNCPSYNKTPGKCINKEEYRNQAKIFHPDKNSACLQSANSKFAYLSNNWNKCEKGGKTKKYNKRRKTNRRRKTNKRRYSKNKKLK
jgi:hypothetical protein